MTSIKKTLFFIPALLASFSMKASPAKMGAWYAYFGQQTINKSNWTISNEVQFRNHNAIGDLDQLLLRGGIGYNLTPNNNNLLLGYGFIHNSPYDAKSNKDNSTFNEHRLFQQLISKQSFGRLGVQHRYRVEQRFFTNDYKTRFRYFVNVTMPINKKQMTNNAVYLTAYNEIFVNAKRNNFDRNRSFAGLGYVISKDLRFDAGLMRQMLESKSRNQVVLSFYNNLPLSIKND